MTIRYRVVNSHKAGKNGYDNWNCGVQHKTLLTARKCQARLARKAGTTKEYWHDVWYIEAVENHGYEVVTRNLTWDERHELADIIKAEK